MDPAFYSRTGFTSGWTLVEMDFYPAEQTHRVIQQIYPFYWIRYGRDQIQNGNERMSIVGIRFNFARQGFLDVDTGVGREPWANQRFKTNRINTNASLQVLRWLYLTGNVQEGYAAYYGPINPFQGKNLSGNFGITFQPNQHINLNPQCNGVRFDRASTGEDVFTVHIINVQATINNIHMYLHVANSPSLFDVH